VQFGIPPETIKDSLDLEGLEVPQFYIVPVERFCREMGRALGVNLAEFEFPAYYNFFLLGRRCTLIVDSDEAERNIRRVFSETLLGPAQFRREENPIAFEEEDFSPDFPRDAIPDFQKELKHFRTMGGKELVLETLLNFCHFEARSGSNVLGVPPPLNNGDDVFFGNDEKKDNPISRGSLLTGSIASTESNGDCVNLSDHNDKISNDSDDPEFLVPVRMDPRKHFEKKRSMSSLSCVVSSTHYARTRVCNEVATIFPNNATPEEIASRKCKRIEIFKMPGGMEYIIHDINEENIIIGKTRFSGNVRVSESLGVHGFSAADNNKNTDNKEESHSSITHYEKIPQHVAPPTFYPPSFGVTVLGNSHGFDKQGSVSGYVLWINGRGVMIDPPPYSSATLEREGIRPRTIVGIILTHCHADHDAGAFQKVLTGSPVVVITTPTIYKSFIRKYAALSALSPVILRHCHRHKPAIIGQPLRFQGATFHFTYTFHTIPCVGFRVEWRGRSMVFTGDHFNDEDSINKLQEEGVLSAARAQDLRNLPLQRTDLLLHEAGIPPIHTPLANLLKLPKRVRDRLYVVHTSQLPPDCGLRVAPTGTAGTIRLDELDGNAMNHQRFHMPDRRSSGSLGNARRSSVASIPEGSLGNARRSSVASIPEGEDYSDDDSLIHSATLFNYSEYDNNFNFDNSFSTLALQGTTKKLANAPPVALRPTSSTDAWFILNLLSAVPFLSGLSYNSTMEVLETARVDAFSKDDVVVPAARRNQVLCVIWEGTCMERRCRQGDKMSEVAKIRPTRRNSLTVGNRYGRNEYTEESDKLEKSNAVWYAGDWTGPRTLQPDKNSSGESDRSKTHDIVAISQEGVKVSPCF
jgi:glyoxylase-like metal-dependent hydrolase (beta-lactamase superfamily II)